jgi:hypothetical protein
MNKEGILINKKIPILVILLLTLIAGCAEKSTDISNNATITHKSYGGFTVPEMQLQELTVNSTEVIFTTSDTEGKFMKTYEKPFNESAFDDLINLFEKNDFLQMNESYTPQEGQPIVADVGALQISLKEENRVKTITVDPYYSDYMPEGLQKIDSALIELRAYALSTSPEEAEKIATNWIEIAPTYSFDGFDLKLEKQEVLEAIPEQHLMTYSFTSRHGGYGNRTDRMVTEVLTPHKIEVIVSEKNVTSAIIDGEWDEMAQEVIGKEPDSINETNSVDNITGVNEQKTLVAMKYRITEEKTPWDQWYEEGNIQFIKAPTPSELIIAYFGTVHNIELADVKKVDKSDVNSSSGDFFYVAKVKEKDFNKMKDLGWTKLVEF